MDVDPIQQLWAEFPEVDFAMAGGILIPGSVTTPNVADWLYNTQDMAWPNGVLSANALVGDTIGIVGGPEFDFVKGMHQSYRDAVLSVNPNIDFLEGFAGSFVDVQRAAVEREHPTLVVEFVAFCVSAEIVVVVEHEHTCAPASRRQEEVGR